MKRASSYLVLVALALISVVAVKHYLGGTFQAGTETVGRPAIGGPFTLIGPGGKPVSDTDFRGKLMLVYFGYTYCPDVCPTSLSAVAAALDILGEDAKQIQPMMITVDPERDTHEALKDYAAAFHPSMIALTGGEQDILKVARSYKAFFAKVREDGDGPDDYLVDHTAFTYLMGRDGEYLAHFVHGAPPEVIAERIKPFLRSGQGS